MRARLTDNFLLNGSYGYTYATFTDYVVSDTENYNGRYVPFVPKHTFHIGGQYRFVLRKNAILDNITVDANYRAAGRIYWTEQNNASQPFYGTLGRAPQLQQRERAGGTLDNKRPQQALPGVLLRIDEPWFRATRTPPASRHRLRCNF